jgi:regulator of sigma E protease
MTILSTIIVLGVLIFVHELGHFAAAKAVGIRVERFSIGLGPRVAGFSIGETDYVLSAIPLGGYVKMGGMDDEMMEKMEGGATTPREPSDSDYDSKPVWARALVISAGVIMNMLFAFGAYTAVAGIWGTPVLETTRVEAVDTALLPEGAEALASIPEGASIVRVGGTPVSTWNELQDALLQSVGEPVTLVLEDPATELEIRVPEGTEDQTRLLLSMSYWTEPVLGEVVPGSPADEAGLEAGDRITAVDGEEVRNWSGMTRLVRPRPEEQLEIGLERDGRPLTRLMTPNRIREQDPFTGETVEVGQIGVRPDVSDLRRYDRMAPGEAVVAGWNATVAATSTIVGFLVDLFTGNVSARNLGGIVTIGQASGQAAQAGVQVFLSFMALFSVNLAILNLLPIPILDGGHLVFLTLEAVRGKPVSAEQRLRWSNVGFLVIMGLMVWALGNDILRLLGI